MGHSTVCSFPDEIHVHIHVVIMVLDKKKNYDLKKRLSILKT